MSAPSSAGFSLQTRIWLALGTLYLVWGSTYLGIRLAIDSMPPLLLCGSRYLIAGAILFAFALATRRPGEDRLTAAHWLSSALIGTALLAIGNGGVAWSQQRVSSGVASLLVALCPLWIAVLNWRFHGKRLGPRGMAGIGLSLVGITLLARPWSADRLDPAGTLVLLIGPVAWAAGSVYSKSAAMPKSALLATGMQMLCGGSTALVVSGLMGELGTFDLAQVTSASLLALAYLVLFGSVLTFTAYGWLLRVAPLSLVSTYAFVNPVVAVTLGWAVLDEPLGAMTIAAASPIVFAVALMVSETAAPPAAHPGGAPASELAA